MGNIRGSSLAGRLRYVKKYHSQAALDQVLAVLKNRDLASKLQVGAVESAWYPLADFVDLVESIDRVLGKGDLAMVKPMAAQTAQDDFSGAYRIFFRLTSPSFVFGKAATIWSQKYDSGKLLTRQLGPTSFELEIVDFDTPHIAMCESIAGWAQRMLELTGAKKASCEHVECRTRKNPRCVWRMVWG
jgi:hypothetical protein